jgi:hypothetical protein
MYVYMNMNMLIKSMRAFSHFHISNQQKHTQFAYHFTRLFDTEKSYLFTKNIQLQKSMLKDVNVNVLNATRCC